MYSNSNPDNKNLSQYRLRIGLTGGIACGKTTTSDRLRALGAGIIDTDIIARDIVTPDSEGLRRIIEAFGFGVLDKDGNLNRKVLRKRIFENEAEKSLLESLLHPIIKSVAINQSKTITGKYIVFVVPLLFESGFDKLVDRILVIDCPNKTQKVRLISRDQTESDFAEKSIGNQIDPTKRMRLADDVIDNSGTIEELFIKIEQIHQYYIELNKAKIAKSN
ncbi:MAG: dephospho-CoA kinase [Pseudomonadota bacterium]|nr:dephospho-CoA kinase [Pseudomonadota bacterium]